MGKLPYRLPTREVTAAFRCPLFRTEINEGQCIEASSVPANNARACCGTACESPWRVCRFCVLQGNVVRPSRIDQPIGETSTVVDRLNARCAFHKQFGTDAKRGEVERSAPTVKIELPPERPNTRTELPPELELRRQGPPLQGETGLDDSSPDISQNLLEVARVLELPVGRIRPYDGQPRKYFDENELEGLSRTLKKVGQITPIIVRPLKPEDKDPHHDWEIIEGERRWRSAQLASKKTVEAIVRVPGSAQRQYLMSAVANFGRVGHTPFETMTVIKEIMSLFGLTMQETADVFGNSYSWVQQYLSLEKLHPKIWEAMAPEIPEKRRLPLTVAKEIARYPEAMQLELLQVIQAKRMRVTQALFHIRQAAKAAGMTHEPRKRSPKETFQTLNIFLDLCGERLERYMGMAADDLRSALVRATSEEIKRVSAKIEECNSLMTKLLAKIRHIGI